MCVLGTMRFCCPLLLLSLLCAAHADVHVWGISGSNLSGDPSGNPPDPYVKVQCGSVSGGMTDFKKDTSNPTWSETFSFRDGKAGDTLRVEVWDKDLSYDDHLGTCTTTVGSGSHRVSCLIGKGTLEFFYEL